MIDVNAYLGHFAFRQLRHNNADGLLRLMDRRQRSWLVDVPDVPLAEIAQLVKACPAARFILVNGAGFSASLLGRKNSGLPANYFIETSRLSAVMANELGQLIATLGEDRVLFGTGMPFHYPDPALLNLEVLAASEEVKEKIRWRNAAKLLENPRRQATGELRG
jgi:hypothetical protein